MNIEAYDIDSLRKLVRSLQNENTILKAQLQKAKIISLKCGMHQYGDNLFRGVA